MCSPDHQGDVDPQIEHGIPRAKEWSQIMQWGEVQLAQIVNSTVSQALTLQMQQIVQQQVPIKYGEPTIEGDCAASWLTWIQRIVYQATTWGFVAELTTAEGEELRVWADVFMEVS